MSEATQLTWMDWMDQFNLFAYRMTEGLVQRGPFKGMKLGTRFSWCSGEIANLLLGLYEQEIQPYLRGPQPYDRIINIGCAEGYYTVGYALRYPKSRVMAFDKGELEREICQENAKLNGVDDRVTVLGECTPEVLADAICAERLKTLIISDCEGAEDEILDPTKVPGLAHCDLIIESHTRHVTETFPARFSATHAMQTVTEGQGVEIPYLRNLLSRDWIIAQAKGITYVRDWLIGRVKA